MNLTVLNPDMLSLNDLVKDMDKLYYITTGDTYMETRGESGQLLSRTTKGLGLWPVSKHGVMSLQDKDFLIVKITDEEIEENIEEDVEESEEVSEDIPEEKPTREYGNRHSTALTYKFFGTDPTESIHVAFRPENSGIRVSFKDKESAEAYFEYFREQFYTNTTGASVITVSNIYSDLNLVNWNKEDCEDWGWYTLDNGTCRYITEVRKTKNTKMWGFTLKRPSRLYETKKREETN